MSPSKPNENAIAFYTQNAGRVDAVAAMLANEQSKQVFLKVVKFRQSRAKEDYPPSDLQNHYFIREFKFDKGEVFIDCGAYNGDTVDKMINNCPDYAHITAFEPDTINFRELAKKHGKNPKITLINAGVYDKDGEVRFNMTGSGNSKVVDGQHDTAGIRVQAIGNLPLEKITFIKMDVEGAELNALKGAEKTILRDKPKLAISIYHSDEDMLRIAEYIHNLVPEYQLHVGHHQSHPSFDETVLYAHV